MEGEAFQNLCEWCSTKKAFRAIDVIRYVEKLSLEEQRQLVPNEIPEGTAATLHFRKNPRGFNVILGFVPFINVKGQTIALLKHSMNRMMVPLVIEMEGLGEPDAITVTVFINFKDE